jgi:hypothetical protein
MELAGLPLDSRLKEAGVRHRGFACTGMPVGTVVVSRAVVDVPRVAQRRHVIDMRAVEHGMVAMQQRRERQDGWRDAIGFVDANMAWRYGTHHVMRLLLPDQLAGSTVWLQLYHSA